MLVGWVAFALTFLMLSQVTGNAGLWLAVIFYGLFTGLSEGAERALISDYAETREYGTAFGWYHLVIGISAIPAGLLFGMIWHYQSAATAFLFAGGLSALAALLLRFWARAPKKLHYK